MTTNDLLRIWRDEVAGELTAASGELVTLTAHREEGIAAHAALENECRELETMSRSITDRPAGRATVPLAGAFRQRIEAHQRARDEASSRRLRAHNAFVAGQRRVSELTLALNQIEDLLASEDDAGKAAA